MTMSIPSGISCRLRRHPCVTWKELKTRSMKSFVSRRVMAPFEVDSSVTKENRTRWLPSRGMSVRVDFASLDIAT